MSQRDGAGAMRRPPRDAGAVRRQRRSAGMPPQPAPRHAAAAPLHAACASAARRRQPAPPPGQRAAGGRRHAEARPPDAAPQRTAHRQPRRRATPSRVPVRAQADSRTRGADRAPAATPIAPTEEGDFWHATVTQLVAAEAITALARELALQSQLVARDVDHWLLRVERESLNQPASRDKLQAALAAAGHAVQLAIEVGAVTDSPARRNTPAAEARQRAAEEAILQRPRRAGDDARLGREIVPGTLRPA